MVDSRLTTHANLAQINAMRIDFLTLLRRSRSLLDAIADATDFFHMDALSAAVPVKTDLQLTLMARELFRLLAGFTSFAIFGNRG